MNKRVINGLIGRTKQLGVTLFGPGVNEHLPALVAFRVSAPLGTPKKAGALFAEVQIRLVCSTRRRASQSRAAYSGVPASASKSLSRSRKPRHPAGGPAGSASSVPGAGQPRCRRAGGRQDDARFSAG